MQRIVVVASAVGIVGLCASVGDAQPVAAGPGPTFTKDVAPIMLSKCATCHRPGEIAPMSLLSYEDTRPWARAIRRRVAERVMPPWGADPDHGTFRNDRSLTQTELDTIVRWVDVGAPKGDDADMPPMPTFASGWQGGEPDFVVEMPEYTVPAEGEIPNQYFWVKNPFEEDRWVEQLELRPGNSGVVHHARVDIVNLPEGYSVVDGRLINPDGQLAEGRGLQSNRTTDNLFNTKGSTFYLIAYVPGGGLDKFWPGTGKRISAGTWIRFNMHYQPNGQTALDQSKLGVWFSKTPVTHEVFGTSVGNAISGLATETGERHYVVDGKLVAHTGGTQTFDGFPNIPAFADNYEVSGTTLIPEPITIYSMWPHLHLRGKDLKWLVTWPDGREETILSVPKYDFNWQISYELDSPLKLPAGSKITAIGHYDNSANNKYNPAPDREVFWGEQSWDEMFSPRIIYTVDRAMLVGRETQQP